MRCDILTIFPEIFTPFLNQGILKRAQDAGVLSIQVHDLRQYTTDSHRSVDDVPYGGGPGMVMKIEPIYLAITSICSKSGPFKKILLSPQGQVLDDKIAKRLAGQRYLLLLCGRYEGVDERVKEHLIDEEISIGDYVLSGGEVPAMVLLETVSRLIPGVLGNANSLSEESFAKDLLEYPQYTRPYDYKGWKVPDVLLSGHHENIKMWRKEQSLLKTAKQRPDLIKRMDLTKEDIDWLKKNGVDIP